MCGRFTIGNNLEKLAEYLEDIFRIRRQNIDTILPRYNVAPSQKVIVIINDGKENRVGLLRWGIPFMPKNATAAVNMINVRCESLQEKPYFSNLAQKKRCIIIADSFYEWKKEGKNKIPIRIMLKDKGFFSMAGLWQSYNNEEQQREYACAIITIPANAYMMPIHERMPAILSSEKASHWLNLQTNYISALLPLLDAIPADQMISYHVSSYINNPANDSEKCIMPIIKET